MNITKVRTRTDRATTTLEPQNILTDPVGEPEDRRKSVRVDDRILLEFWQPAEESDLADVLPRFPQVPLVGSPDATEGPGLHPLIAQWMSKIEWTLDAILRTLDHHSPRVLAAPRLLDVNISGEAIRFLPDRPLAVGDRIDLRMILAPFLPVETKGEVIQVRPDPTGAAPYPPVVVRFVDISDVDLEKIIRYVVQRRTDLLKRRP
jgi:hypothetical protein